MALRPGIDRSLWSVCGHCGDILCVFQEFRCGNRFSEKALATLREPGGGMMLREDHNMLRGSGVCLGKPGGGMMLREDHSMVWSLPAVYVALGVKTVRKRTLSRSYDSDSRSQHKNIFGGEIVQ